MERFSRWRNLTAMFFDQAERRADRPFLWAMTPEGYRSISWRETAERVTALARGLEGLGVEPGDRVVLVAENRPEWMIADLAIMAIGGVTVPAYTTNTPDDHRHILTNSGAKAAIVSTRKLAESLLPAVHTATEIAFVVAIEPPGLAQDIGAPIHAWDVVLDQGRGRPDDIRARAATLDRDDLACLIYTSGTGGAPKGVMLSHGAILCNCMGAYEVLLELDLGDEVFLSFLPLSHAYEHTAGQFLPISIGAEIYYAEGVETLLRNLGEAKPTLMTAVPRLYETMHGRISRDVLKAGGLKAKLFARAIELGRMRYEKKPMSVPEWFQDRLLDKLVRDKVRGRFGGRLKALVSGGAPLNPDIGIFFTALGLRLLQGYGQTESAPVISVNRPSNNKLHTVGPAMRGVEVKIAPDGEILVRGELVMHGYWHNSEATAEAIRDGWLHTGDIGVIDEQGSIIITDRKKDIIVNSGGDNVSPQRVEGFLTLEPEVLQAMVYGDKRPYLVGLVVPDPDFAKSWAAENGKNPDIEALCDDADFKKAIMAAVERVNHHMSTTEKVRRVTLIPEAFSITNEMMTPTMKIRRHKIKATYGPHLEALYGGG